MVPGREREIEKSERNHQLTERDTDSRGTLTNVFGPKTLNTSDLDLRKINGDIILRRTYCR